MTSARSLLSFFGLCLLFLIAFALMRAPALSYIHDAYWGGVREDPGLYVWLMQYSIDHLFSIPSQGFDVGFFYPFGRTLAFSDNFLFPSALGALLVNLAPNFAATFNGTLLFANALTFLLFFALARYILGRTSSALYATFLFSFSSFLTSHWGHPQLQFAFVLPAAILCVLWFVEKRSFLAALGIGASFFVAFLSAVYYAVFIAILIPLIFLYYYLLRSTSFRLKDLLIIAAGALPWLILLQPILEKYTSVREAFGGREALAVFPFRTTILTLFNVPETNLLWGRLLHGLAHAEGMLFFGFSGLLLALLGAGATIRNCQRNLIAHGTNKKTLFIFKWSKHLGTILALTFSVALGADAMLGETSPVQNSLLSFLFWLLLFYLAIFALRINHGLSSALGANRRFVVGQALCREERLFIILVCGLFFLFASFGIRDFGHGGLPWLMSFLREIVPGADAIRATPRFGIVAVVAFSILAGFGLDAAQNRLAQKFPRALANGIVISAVFIVIAALELRCGQFPLVGEEHPTEAYQHLASLPGNEAVIALPFSTPLAGGKQFAHMQTEYMRWFQLVTSRPMVNGYSGVIPKFHQTLQERIKGFPNRSSLNFLGRIVGLRYIVFNPRYAGESFSYEEFEKSIAQFPGELKIILRDSGHNILLEFTPTVRVNGIALFTPPSPKRERRINFELMGGNSEKISIRYGFAVDTEGEKVALVKEISLPAEKRWEPVQLMLPRSIQAVLPHKLLFENSKNMQPLFARNIVIK